MAEPLRTEYGKTAWVFNPDGDEQWDHVAEELAGFVIDDAFGVVQRVLALVRDQGCRTVVLERQYIDPDYRSEYAAFWAGRFERRPNQASRAHFFTTKFSATDLPELPTSPGYLGYSVMRPTELGAVGRTILTPPEELKQASLTLVVDRPSMFGYPLEVRGVPFCQQDGELLRCSHAAAWVCHYVAAHHRIIARRLTAEIAAMPSVEGSKHRSLPSTGITGEQLQGVFSAIGIPAYFLEIDGLPELPADLVRPPGVEKLDHNRRVRDERIFRVVCKYLNSGFPVVVLTEADRESHALTLVGWKRTEAGDIQLIACDDRIGPYETIVSPTQDGEDRGEWQGLMLPLPNKVYLTGEAAETRARALVSAEFDYAASEEQPDPARSDLSKIAPDLMTLDGPVSVRARLVPGRRYKVLATRQGRHPEAVRVARMAHLPHWVWVVEFMDRAARAREEPCVMAEVVFDSTSHDERPSIDLLFTRSFALDVDMADETEAGEQLGIGRPDGRVWRSLISDPTVSDREYGSAPDPIHGVKAV